MRSKLLVVVWASLLGGGACDGESSDGEATDDTGSGGGTTMAEEEGSSGVADGADTIDPPAPTSLDGGSDGSGDGDTGAPALACADYCSVYMDACADHGAYANEQDCMDHCAQWPIGDAADTAGDSLGCRIYHATVASTTEPDLHCPHAAPNGGGVCADADAPSCADYCDAYLEHCTEDLGAYVDLDDCLEQCEPWYQGTTADTAGNTVGCRTYHGGAPAVGDPELHCPHAGPGGAGVCVFP